MERLPERASHRVGERFPDVPADELQSIPVPLGWHLKSARDDPQGFPFYQRWSMLWALLSKLIGLSITAVAIYSVSQKLIAQFS